MTARIKERIKRSFNRAVNTYDQHCFIQNKVSDIALDRLVSYQGNFSRIADFACGTGESTKRLVDRVNYVE